MKQLMISSTLVITRLWREVVGPQVVNSFWKCFSSGSYKFTITDAYGDGICCSYGNDGYSVKVDDKEVASGGQFGSKEEKTFNVVSSTDSPVAPPSTTPPVAS